MTTSGVGRRLAGVLSLAAACAAAAPARAEPAPTDPKLERAKVLFRSGTDAYKAGGCEPAIEFFLRSRELAPAAQNTHNSAYCLAQLGRLDEALELYEELFTKFGEHLSDKERAAAASSLQELRRKLGSLEIGANVDGIV